MPDPTAEFFEELGRRGYDRMFRKIIGTVRFELEHEQQFEHWHLSITKGSFRVARGRYEADTVVHTEKATFEQMVRGETKPLAGLLRNDITVEGKLQMFLLLERLLPGPPGARDPRAAAGGERRP